MSAKHSKHTKQKNKQAQANNQSLKGLKRVDFLVDGDGYKDSLSPSGMDETKRAAEEQIIIKLDNSKLNAKPIGQIVDELNTQNPDIDPAKSYVDVDELGKGERLVFALNRLCLLLERARIGDYVSMMGNTRGMMIKNFLAGIARGFGYGIGFLVLAAIAIYILKEVVDLGIPVIGNFLANILDYVDQMRQGVTMIK